MSDEHFQGLAARFRLRAIGDAKRLRDALAASNRETVAAIAHGLSGTAGIFGFTTIGELAAALERAAEDGDEDWADAAPLMLTALDRL